MSLTASLSDSVLSVAPGDDVSCVVSVRNSGPVVDQVTLDVVGSAADWSTLEPSTVNVHPGQSVTARLTFHPPRAPEVPAGPTPFAVRVLSEQDPEGATVEEGVVEVGAFTDISAILRPTRSRARRRGAHRLTIVNRGNVPVPATVHFRDPEEVLSFKVNHRRVTADPGIAEQLRVRVTPRERFLRGPDENRPFQVVVVPEWGEGVTVNGALVQRPAIPGWMAPVLAAGFAAVVAFAALWLTVLKPTIRSAATEAVNARLAPVAGAARQAQDDARAAHTEASKALANNPNGLGFGGTPTSTPTSGPPSTHPVDFRIEANAVPRKGFYTFTASGQSKRPLDLTDFELQNPTGDSGIVQIRRNNAVLLTFALDNFRSYDDHFVVPIHFDRGAAVVFAVSCQNPGAKPCTPALTFLGRTG